MNCNVCYEGFFIKLGRLYFWYPVHSCCLLEQVLSILRKLLINILKYSVILFYLMGSISCNTSDITGGDVLGVESGETTIEKSETGRETPRQAW